MVLKRSISFSQDSQASVAKRLKRVERKQNLYGPTKLLRNVLTTDAGALADGAIRTVALWVASDTKIIRVSIKGYLGGTGVDAYLLQAEPAIGVSYSNFTPTIGGCLSTGSGPHEEGCVIWKHYLSLNGGTNFSITQKFKYGFTSLYDSSLMSGTGKQLYFVIKNDSGAAVSPQATIEVWYSNLTP